MLKAAFYTLGCRLNQAETSLIANSFENKGYQVVEGINADVFVINSCTVTSQAEAKCRQLVRKILRQNPDTYIAVVGCYSQVASQALKKIEGIDLIVGNADKAQLVELIDEPLKTGEAKIVRNSIVRRPFTVSTYNTMRMTTRANLKVQDGCDFMCSFCLIPFARGRARSRDFEDIRREASELIEAGYLELVLTGVNIGTYQFEDKDFADIVEMLLGLPGLGRLRISSMEPTAIPERLFEIMASDSKLCRHMHIPAQSGSNSMLKRMNRRYTREEYIEFIERAAEKLPDIMLATDLIVGFPGEQEKDFEQSCRLLTDSPLAYAHVFSFSRREGTAAAKLDGEVDNFQKKERSRHLQNISRRKKQLFYSDFVDKELCMISEEQDEQGWWLGFSDNYIKIAVDAPHIGENQMVKVKTTGLGDGLMKAVILK